jgi:pilus assembly protein CpaE
MPPGQKIAVLIVDDIAETRENIRKLLQFEADIEVTGMAKTGREAVTLAKEKRPNVVIMDINMPDMDGITATEQITRDVPSAQNVILSVQSDADYLRRAMMAGARDFLSKPPSGDELVSTIRRAYEISKSRMYAMPMQSLGGGTSGQASAAQEGRVIVVYSPKGGVGCTTLATNLALALQTEEQRVCLVDCNLQFGDVAVFLNIKPQHSVIELFESADGLDPEYIASVAMSHDSGIKVFLAPASPEQADVVQAPAVKKTLEVLRTLYHYVIVDTSSGLNDTMLSVFDASDKIILVTTPDIPAIKDSRIFFELTDVFNYTPDRIMFVLNKVDKRGGISAVNIQESIKHEVASQIPLEERVLFSINSGKPLYITNKTIPFAMAISDMAAKLKASFQPLPEKETVVEEKQAAKKPAPRRLFGA